MTIGRISNCPMTSYFSIYHRELPNPLFTHELYEKFVVSVGTRLNSPDLFRIFLKFISVRLCSVVRYRMFYDISID